MLLYVYCLCLDACGFNNTETQMANELAERGCRFELKVDADNEEATQAVQF